MSRIRIAPIVEGHGEVAAIRVLIERIWREIVGGEYVEILQPLRRPKSKLVKADPLQKHWVVNEEELQRAVGFAAQKLVAKSAADDPALILVLLDADADCPAELAPELMQSATKAAAPFDVVCVLPKVEYETWFVAAAESLADYLTIKPEDAIPEQPEESRSAKRWIERRFKGNKYSETLDQPGMTAKIDLSLCRRRSPSFNKLCRELEKRR